MLMTTTITTLFVGDGSKCEFRRVLSTLKASTHAKTAVNLDEATALLAVPRETVDLIILAVSRPGEIRCDQFDDLVRQAPLSRIILVLGSWCEGEQRSGKPWPGGQRVFWYDWSRYWQRELESVAHGLCPTWGRPVTTTHEELTDSTVTLPTTRSAGLIVLDTPVLETADTLADLLRVCGYATYWVRSANDLGKVAGATSAVWEGTMGDDREVAHLARLSFASGRIPIVALLDFPRADRIERLLAAGAAHVVAKPFLLDDLLTALQRATLGSQATHRDGQLSAVNC